MNIKLWTLGKSSIISVREYSRLRNERRSNMRKYAIIISAIGFAGTLVITSFWQRISEFISINALFQFVAVILVTGIVLQITYSYFTSWKMVNFSKWEKPFPNPIWGGIKISNNTWVEMTECKAELIGYDDDFSIKEDMPAIADVLIKDGTLDGENSLLFWMADGSLTKSITLGRGKNGYIVLAFGIDEQDKKIVSPELNWSYKINTSSGQSFVHPFNNGYVYVRISAKFNNEPVKPIIKSVRFEVKEKTLFIKDVESV